jgi:periplasmic divalent cation tolerance protein
MSNIVEVTTTVGSPAAASELAKQIIDARLAACVQIDGPVTSIYRWQGEVCEAQEWRCTMKTLAPLTRQLEDAISRAHPYETPEILILPVAACAPAYAQWLAEQVIEANDA